MYRSSALWASMLEETIRRVVGRLAAAGVQPLLAKGWAVARLYPELGLRPYSDVDLLVQPDHHGLAMAALSGDRSWHQVDLHARFAELVDRPPREMYRRSMLVPLGDVEVRVLAPEDHLRLLCQHLLRHGAVRAAWLCDVAVILESLPPSFDWEYCLAGDRRRAEWMLYTIGLACQLLGAEAPSGAPFPGRPLPCWLVNAFLHEWGRETPGRGPQPLIEGWPAFSARRLLAELRCRWPSPVTATMFWRAAFDDRPRWPFQVASYVVAQALAVAGRRWTLMGFE